MTVEIDPHISLGDYIEKHWAPVMRKRVTADTARSYESDARVHIPAELKALPIAGIRRGQLKRMIADLTDAKKLAPASMAKIGNVLRSIFASAYDDEVIDRDPSEKIGRVMGLHHFYVENVRAMDGDQLSLFLTVAREREPAHFLAFAILAYAGLRIGEARGLWIEDVDLAERHVHVNRQVLESGVVIGPKGRRGNRKTRVVDMSEELAGILEPALAVRREYDMRTGRRTPWFLFPDMGNPPTLGGVSTVTHRLRRAMRRVLSEAKIQGRFTPHSFRHTFATLMLTRGEELLYVSRQLGDVLNITAEIYGKWAKVPPKAGGTNLLTARLPTVR